MLLSGNTSQQDLLFIFSYCATTSLPGGRRSCNSSGKTAVSETVPRRCELFGSHENEMGGKKKIL